MRKNLKIIVIVLIITIIFSILSFFLKGERPDDLYRKMKNLHDNQTLIGLSKEEVPSTLASKGSFSKDNQNMKVIGMKLPSINMMQEV